MVFYLIAFLDMAPHIGDWQHAFIKILLAAGARKRVCAHQADCSPKAIQRIWKKMKLHKKTRLGREYKSRRILSNKIIIALLCQLNEAPNLYLDKITWFIYNRFQVVVTRKTLGTALAPSSKILNSLRASDLAWLPPTVHSNRSERLCLAVRT